MYLISDPAHPLPGIILRDLEDPEHDEEQMKAAWSLPTGAGLKPNVMIKKSSKLPFQNVCSYFNTH